MFLFIHVIFIIFGKFISLVILNKEIILIILIIFVNY